MNHRLARRIHAAFRTLPCEYDLVADRCVVFKQERRLIMNTAKADGDRVVRPFWSPLVAGIALGLVLLLTFYLTRHGLGASGAATNVVAAAGLAIAPVATHANGYLGPMVADGSPMGSWMTWEVLGIAIGGLIAAFMAGRFRVQLDGARSVGSGGRLLKALVGGSLAGFGARVAGGCTSGLGLSGSAALGVAAFVFLGLFFATGLIVSRLVRGV
jgi:uncharacterized membrane protein YedE/YeeE